MRELRGNRRVTAFAWFFAWALVGCVSSSAAILRWEPNPPSDNIAFYTVYAESVTGTLKWEVRDETSFPLDPLLSSVTYLLSVSATSVAGLESERSTALSFTAPAILPPLIIANPVSTNLASGNPLFLSVSATSLSPITYQWQKDGQKLAGQTGETFFLPNAAPADSGDYTVVVSNQRVGVVSNPARVMVQDPPSIVTQPTAQTADAGTTASLSVGAAGTNPRYQWYKSDLPIRGETNATLLFANVTTQNRGTYHVMVSNLVARVTSAKVALMVNVHPVVIVTPPAGTNLTTGGTIRLAANATGTRPFSFEWFKDGVPIPNAIDEQLLISSASTNDSGEYRVRISNTENWVTSAVATVTVREAAVVEGLLSLRRSPGGLLHLTGVATPNASYELQWSDSLVNPDWTRLQDVPANSAGHFEVILTSGQNGMRFFRTVHR